MGKIEFIEPAHVGVVRSGEYEIFKEQVRALAKERVVYLPVVRKFDQTAVALCGIEGLMAAHVLGVQCPIYVPENRKDFIQPHFLRHLLSDPASADSIASNMNTSVNYGFERAAERAGAMAFNGSAIIDVETLVERTFKGLVHA
jgi:hypothetical protein